MSGEEHDNKLRFNSEYLNDYLAMVEDTESPRIYHIWSAIFAVASTLGRRCYLPFGSGEIFPNHYMLLIGTPGTRKSSAANLGKKLLKSSTGVRFAPDDTGFQRQGLVLALQGEEKEQKEFVDGVELAGRNDTLMSLTQLEEVTNTPEEEDLSIYNDTADKHAIAIIASEFSRIIGQNNLSMMDFLGERYDGESYEYQTKGTYIKLKNTLINMLACSTPTSIANALPPQAGGQGFLSRVILVYGAKKYKKVPRPTAPDPELVGRVKDRLDSIFRNIRGAFSETTDAASYCVELYDYPVDITDSRFAYYVERRYTHLIKLAMCLAASRGEQIIRRVDYEEAHRILRATEIGMPAALGEFGMNPLAQVKQEILETLRSTMTPYTMHQIIAMFHRDARSQEIMEVVNDLVRTKQVYMQQSRTGERLLTAAFSKQNTEDAMMHLLREMMKE